MSDFAQTGLICTLQQLAPNPAPHLEAELLELALHRPIGLVLPCHAAELDQPALLHIREELRAANWLHDIVVSFNGLDSGGWQHAQRFFGGMPQRLHLLWNDGPQLGPLLTQVQGSAAHGKGLNLWAGIGAVLSMHPNAILLTQDCDVLSFRRENLARLAYAAAHPELGFSFAKMYYSRATDRLYGRVTRLFLAPLLQAVVRVAGHHPLLDFLRSFRYLLAGEIAIGSDLAAALPIDSSWGVEIGMLARVFRQVDPRTVAQVDGGSGYEHRHHPAEEGGSLARMAREISQTLLAALQREGCGGTDFTWEAVGEAYLKEGHQAVQRSSALARINGLPHDADAEIRLVELFATELLGSAVPYSAPLPSWDALRVQNPDWVAAFARELTLLTNV